VNICQAVARGTQCAMEVQARDPEDVIDRNKSSLFFVSGVVAAYNISQILLVRR
jgi:hypothetical protein